MIRERRRHAVVATAASINSMEQASRVHSSYNNIPNYCLPPPPPPPPRPPVRITQY